MNNYRFACLVGVVLLWLVLSGSVPANFVLNDLVFAGSVTRTTATFTIHCNAPFTGYRTYPMS